MAIVLRVDPSVLRTQSNQVRNDIRQIKRHLSEIDRLVNGTRSYWEGDASNAHFRIYKDLEDDINQIMTRLSENPVKLQKMAGVYEEGESKAQGEAQRLPTEVF